MNKYTFDFIAFHPKPIFPESQVGYIQRLSKENEFTSKQDLWKLLFTDLNKWEVRNISDFPLRSINSYKLSVNCSEEEIYSTTFLYLAKFFGKPKNSQVISKFLAGAISTDFRYCPQCLRNFKRYSLLWRFNEIIGCHLHNCYLENRCWNCGKTNRIDSDFFSFCECPHCGKSYEDAVHRTIPNQLTPLQIRIAHDIEYLLHPNHNILIKENKPQLIGLFLEHQRKELGLKVNDIHKELGFSTEKLLTIERGIFEKNRTRIIFLDYLKYFRFLNIGFQDFNNVDGNMQSDHKNFPSRTSPVSTEDFIIRIKQIVDSSSEQLTLDELCRKAGVNSTRFYVDSSIYRLSPKMKNSKLIEMQKREEEHFIIVQKLLESYREKLIEFTFYDISFITGITKGILTNHKKIHDLIVETQKLIRVEKENKLIYKIDDFIKSNQKINKVTSIKGLENCLGLSRERLKSYPKILKILKGISDT